MLLIFLILCIASSFSTAAAASQSQQTLYAPIYKDPSTQLYALKLYLKTPFKPTTLHLSLNSLFTWLVCDDNIYNSTSYTHPPCNSSVCSSFHTTLCSSCFDTPSITCANNTCIIFPENPIARNTLPSIALTDNLRLPAQSLPGQFGLVPEFVFSCSNFSLLSGLASNVVGLVGLGRSNNSLPAQVSRALSIPRVFALCLSGSDSGSGVGIFGSGGPYLFENSGIDLAENLIYTQLILNPVGDTMTVYAGQPSGEYFVNLTSIKVNGQPIQFNGTLLTVDDKGYGGTKISTDAPYTTLQSSIYKALTEAFINESSALNLTVTTPMPPFNVCYSVSAVTMTRVGPGVPTVDLVMESRDDVFWRIFGSNSMARITKDDMGVDVWCLSFIDGGPNPRTSIVIGGHQIEDNLLLFNLESNRLGFSSSVLVHGTTCASFKL